MTVWPRQRIIAGHAGALQDSSASVIRREGHSPTRHHSHHGHQVSGTELNGLNVKVSADLIFHLRYDFIPRSQWDADTGSRRHWTFQDGMVVDSCDMSWCLGCDFRHTDFVELTAPLLKSAVLRGIELRQHKIPHVPRSFWKRLKNLEEHSWTTCSESRHRPSEPIDWG